MARKSTTITIETERYISISRWHNRSALCAACGDEVRLTAVNEAAGIAGLTSLAIYRLVESGTLHHIETPAGELLICAVSLGSFISNQRSVKL